MFEKKKGESTQKDKSGTRKEYRVYIGECDTFGLGGPITEFGVMYIGYEDETGKIVKERGRVLVSCDESEYRKLLKKVVGRYCVMRIFADKDGNTFYKTTLLDLNTTPTEQEVAFLNKESLPVFLDDPQFGRLSYNKSVDFFEGEVSYDGKSVNITLEGEENMETLRILFNGMESFSKNAVDYAVEKLLEIGDDWCYDAWEGEDEDYVHLTAEEFARRISLETISVSEDGDFSLWYDDGEIFWGHIICVDGNINGTFSDANFMG